jgi:hypothetical protein
MMVRLKARIQQNYVLCALVRKGPGSRSKVWDPGTWIQCVPQNGDLRQCLLSYYLDEMEQTRSTRMSHLRGEASDEEPPLLYTKLAKVPVGCTVLANRGFFYDAPSYPNVNSQVTPHVEISSRSGEGQSVARMLLRSDIMLCI